VGVHGEQAAGRGEAAAIGAEGHLLKTTLPGITPGALFPAGLRVPDLNHVLSARGKPPAVRTELHAADRPGKSQRERLLTSGHTPALPSPYFSCFITAACRSQPLPVRAEGYTPSLDDRASVFAAKNGRGDLVLKRLLHVPNVDL